MSEQLDAFARQVERDRQDDKDLGTLAAGYGIGWEDYRKIKIEQGFGVDPNWAAKTRTFILNTGVQKNTLTKVDEVAKKNERKLETVGQNVVKSIKKADEQKITWMPFVISGVLVLFLVIIIIVVKKRKKK